MRRATLLTALFASGCVRLVVQPLHDAELIARSRTYRAIADLRELGVALESYNVDNGHYPLPQGQPHTIGGAAFFDASTLTGPLTGYIRVLAAEDPWGEPYQYWAAGDAFLALSLGADGKVTDPTYLNNLVTSLSSSKEPVLATTSACAEDEIVFAFGRFVRAPTEGVKLCSASGRARQPHL